MGIIFTIIAFGFVILVHELGHLIIAKKAGIGVYEFSVGFGPKIFSKKIKNTVYALRALPFGGFVKVAGMDDQEEEKTPPELDFNQKPLLHRAATIAAGSFCNILFGFLLFFLAYTIFGIPFADNTIQKIKLNSPTAHLELQPGDKILQLNNYPISSGLDVAQALKKNSKKRPNNHL
jgi:regulator of sigma E protease